MRKIKAEAVEYRLLALQTRLKALLQLKTSLKYFKKGIKYKNRRYCVSRSHYFSSTKKPLRKDIITINTAIAHKYELTSILSPFCIAR